MTKRLYKKSICLKSAKKKVKSVAKKMSIKTTGKSKKKMCDEIHKAVVKRKSSSKTRVKTSKKFDIIYADPPWNYRGQGMFGAKHESTGDADDQYPTMTLKELKKIVVPSANNALLFMWTSSPHLDQAIELGKSWGFDYKTIAFVWDKQIPVPGFYTMSQIEICLVFKKGKIPKPRGARNVRQFISEKRREHSRKPDVVRDRIHRMFPTQKKLEMFARVAKKGWSVWGNETKKFKRKRIVK